MVGRIHNWYKVQIESKVKLILHLREEIEQERSFFSLSQTKIACNA